MQSSCPNGMVRYHLWRIDRRFCADDDDAMNNENRNASGASLAPAPVSDPISDRDVLDAMARIPGYLDISVEDFRVLYAAAREQALHRTFADVRAGSLMRAGIEPLTPDTMLDQAARTMVAQGLKAIPVVDADRRVVAILTETDFLRRLQAPGFLALMLDLMDDPGGFSHRCHETPVRVAMTSPPECVLPDAGFDAIGNAFRRCGGRSLPVTDADGRLLGLLPRKAFVAACGSEVGS